MGALCGKESHFKGEGQTLGGPPSSSSKPQSYGATSNVLGSSSSKPPGASSAGAHADERAARAAAAEARVKAAQSKGIQGTGGQLAKKTDSQARDGGRKEEALRVGAEGRQEDLRWD
ncbi:hypothetical protein BT69DRAFT_1288170 [Atractiella rhizophila]|nr:hypothetical protein BT69DRAFT_1288170 [Atractiella rhizophila]